MELRSSRVLKNIDLSIENKDSVDEKSSDKSQKGESEIEIRVCVENVDEDLESGWINGRKSENTDDKCLFLGSEVLDPIKDVIISCPEGEIEECSERNRLNSVNLSDTNPDFKEEINSPDKDTINCENGSPEKPESGKFSDDDDDDKAVKRKRGRKRKNMESSGCNRVAGAKKGGIPASGRVLRSRNLTGSVDGGLKRMARTELEPDSGRPKKKLKRRGRPPKVSGETLLENSQRVAGKPNKKLKRRGRPPKVQGETMPENNQLSGIPVKKLKTRGRPRKVLFENIETRCRGRPRKDIIFTKLKRSVRGRPPKVQARNIATHVIKMRTVKLMAVKGKNVKTGPKIPRKKKRVPEVAGDNQVPAEDLPENWKSGGRVMERRKEQQLVRDRIVEILLNAGWTIDRRSRPDRVYKDAVYIDPKGRGHWSITKAYNMLKKKIEDGDADSNEIAAFTPIPDNEFSILFRFVTKVRSDKNIKKIAGTGKKKPVKKKTIRNPANKSSNVKRKRHKSQNERPKVSRKPCLLARTSEKGSGQDQDGGSVYNRKRNLLTWMIDSGVVLVGSKVQYGKTRRQKRAFEGTVSGDGIHCGCCNEVMGVSEFAGHAGGKLWQLFDNVFLDSGTSFRQCLTYSWRKEEGSNTIGFNLVDVKGDDPNDDTCNICGDGGDLICCDSCPSTFHESCLDIQNFPSGDWNCIYCSCKFCRAVSVSNPQTDNSHDAEMLSCCLCEEKFHESCLQKAEDVTIDFGKQTFCGRKCEELFEQLQTCLGVKSELEDGFSWTLLQRSEVGQDLTLHETQTKVEQNSKLAVAFSVMDECFVPIVDERSGTNIIHNVVFNCGSNIRRLNYAGFFTAILEKGDELVSAASIRIHGHRLAEMPFIGTRHMYRRQGMCRRLLDAIESTLSSLGVEELVIPAIPELLQTWTKAFGFTTVEESMRQAMKSMSMMVFPGIDMLQKPLFRNQSAVSDDKDMECIAENVNQLETVSSKAIDCKQTEDDTRIENDKSMNSHDANGLCDLNFPAKDVSCEVPELPAPVLSYRKFEIPVSDSYVQVSDDSVTRERLPELELRVENDGVIEVKASPKVVPKNSFDLNLHPAAIDSDMHIVDDISLTSAVGLPDSKPCDAQPIVLL